MSGTDIASGVTSVRACYAKPGTEIAYAGAAFRGGFHQRRRAEQCGKVASKHAGRISLSPYARARRCPATSRTDGGYGTAPCPMLAWLLYGGICISLRTCYAMSGIDMGVFCSAQKLHMRLGAGQLPST
eukprot:3013059-Rhodomonas_salina.3